MSLKGWDGFEYGDIIVLLGLSTMGYGLWMHSPWASLTVVGLILIALGTKRR